jgi:5-methylcytosine-specific restriction endonuclease McrA
MCRLDETIVKGELVEMHAQSASDEYSRGPRRREFNSEQPASSERSRSARQRRQHGSGLGRYVPAAVRRAVAERDGECCAYVDDEGRRCRETSALELHHLEPHARGGPPTEANLSLRCRAHNALAAEGDFGREFMADKIQLASAPSR